MARRRNRSSGCVAEESKVFISRASVRRTSALTLGKARDACILESWIKQHDVTQKASDCIATLLSASDAQTAFRSDDWVSLLVALKSSVGFYKTYKCNAEANLVANWLRVDDEDWVHAAESYDEAERTARHFEDQFLSSLTTYITKQSADMRLALKTLCHGDTPEKSSPPGVFS